MPDDAKILRAIMGISLEEYAEHWPILREKFATDAEGHLFNERLKSEKDKKLRLIEIRKLAGSKGGRPRKSKRLAKGFSTETKCKANVEEGSMDSSLLGLPRRGTPKKNAGAKARTSKYSAEFQTFWAAFAPGRKTNKPDAATAFEGAVVAVSEEQRIDGQQAAEYLARRAADYAQSNQGQSAYVRGPTPWLNQQAWNDPPEAWQRKEENGKPKRHGFSVAELRAMKPRE